MKNLRFFAVLALSFCILGSGHTITEGERPDLVSISRNDPSVVSLLKDRGIPVHLVLKEWFLAQAAPADLAQLEKAGIEYKVLDKEAWSDPYYLITRPRGKEIGEIPDVTQVVFKTGTEALVKSPPKQAFELGRFGFHVTRISSKPQPLFTNRTRDTDRILEKFQAGHRTDDVIGVLVNQVSQEIMRPHVQRLQDFQTRYYASDSLNAAAQWLFDRFVEFGYSNVQFDEFEEPLDHTPVKNVIATKPGVVHPDSVIMMGAHYDSAVIDGTDPYVWAPGADDNASGVVGVLEAARILADVDFDCTIKFVCWSAEEWGYFGSEHYAERAYNQGEKIGLYINYDMLGYIDEDDPVRDIDIGWNPTGQPYADLMAEMVTTYTSLVPITYPAAPVGSDYGPFMAYGYDILSVMESDPYPFIHSAGDIIDRMNFSYMCEAVKMGLATLATVAGPPASVSLPHPMIALESYSWDDDSEGGSVGNGNGFFDTGETIDISLSLRNIGDTPADNVTAYLLTDDPYVTLSDKVVSCGHIPAGGTGTGQDQFRFSISEACPNGHFLDFSVEAHAAGGYEWMSYFSVRVVQPTVWYITFNLQETVGNENGAVDPGETVNLSVFLGNDGLRNTSGVTATLATDDPDVLIVDGDIGFPDMDVHDIKENEAEPFVLSVAEGAIPRTLYFTLNVSEGEGYYRTEIPIQVSIGQSTLRLVADDGGAGYTGYYIDALQNIGVPYEIDEIEGVVMPHSEDLSNYSEVIWFTSGEESNTLTPDDRSDLEIFLESGGKLILSGAMIGYEVGNTSFYRNYVHGRYISFITLLHHLNGAPSNPVVGSQDITLASRGFNGQGFTGEIDPISPAVPLFTYDRSTDQGPGIIRSSGSAALAVETSAYKVAYFSFGLEGIEPLESRAQVLEDILSWFKKPGIDKGDVNGNGVTDIIDAVVTVNIVLGMYQPDEQEVERADMNYDGAIDIIDVVRIVNAVLGTSGKAAHSYATDL
ncbi:MAG: M20/M25/M40 family metallo-hydrolase [Gemmatimonadota bacterium]|nr:MAG: M20/M25/M40 family metallo-hydrolase [Gemmatimonadota bacterium]